ncbi:hypothetical protein [Rhodopila globiformis]|uniref:Uncharacterized protein n=1 Tax=Rhodopila globiformis TaxID=1071 RepID=A0A2S6MWY0_RHOGL|nr:hypothetical protein [Rhodopila globiformis]PPQ26866.1 hypothetical protein CCS01_28715 [Rhodopila globiformis]
MSISGITGLSGVSYGMPALSSQATTTSEQPPKATEPIKPETPVTGDLSTTLSPIVLATLTGEHVALHGSSFGS